MTHASFPIPAQTVNLRPEIELLLCCARANVDAATAERMRALLREEIDWTYLTETAYYHGVSPLLYWSLHTTCPDAVPTALLAQLREQFRIHTVRNLFLTTELCTLLNLLEVNGIPAIPLKGPVLAASVYGNIALRQFADLDILVHQRDILPAKDLLMAHGYQSVAAQRGNHPDADLADADLLEEEDPQDVAYRQPKYYVLVREDDYIRVDLQWRIARTSFVFSLDTERVWDHLGQVSLTGTTVRSLSPEDLFLFLCLHGGKHLWEQLKWICDITEMVRRHPGFDWGYAMELASRQGGKRMCMLGLLLAHDLFEMPLPEEVLHKIQADPVVRSVAGQVRERLFAGTPEPAEDAERLRFYLKLQDRWQDRVRYWGVYSGQYLAAALTPTPKDRALIALPSVLAFLYYVLRPLRLVGEYGLSLLRYVLKL